MALREVELMRTLLIRSATTATTVATDLAMLMWNDGLQGAARRNAWVAVVDDSRRARDRAAAAASVAAAEAPEVVALAR
jgi:hypothetical protein